jgi:hypothetical protein
MNAFMAANVSVFSHLLHHTALADTLSTQSAGLHCKYYTTSGFCICSAGGARIAAPSKLSTYVKCKACDPKNYSEDRIVSQTTILSFILRTVTSVWVAPCPQKR